MSSMVSNITGRLRRPLALSVIAVMLMVAVAVPFVIDNAVAAETTSYKYKVYLSGSTYYVKNAAGATVYSSTNAAASIQKALSSLTSGRTVKETVQLQGSFVLTKALSVPSYTVLNLDGTITMGAGSNTNMIYSSGVSYVDIVGGEWNGNQAAQTQGYSARDGLVFSKSHYVTIKDLKVHDAPYHGINCLACDHVTISNVEVYNNGNYNKGTAYRAPGIMMYACNDCTVENCYVHDTSKGGIYFYTEDDGTKQTINNNVFRGNRVERTWTTGIEVGCRGLEDICYNNIVKDNICVDCGRDGEHAGIMMGWVSGTLPVRYADRCTVSGNAVSETGKYYSAGGCGGGIAMQSKYSTCSNNVVSGTYDSGISCRGSYNTISTNTISKVKSSVKSGIQFADGNNNEVVNNKISDCANGVAFYTVTTKGCNNNHVANNRIEKCSNCVVKVNDRGSTGNVIELNTFVTTKTILNSGTGTVIRSNTFIA